MWMMSFIKASYKNPLPLREERERENWTIAVETIGGMREREREVIFQIFLPNKTHNETLFQKPTKRNNRP
jgi:hypothetical protein